MPENQKSRKGSLHPNRMMLRRTLFLLVVCGIVAFIVLGIRLYKLQIVDHDMYEKEAINQQVRKTVVTANRGTIYDRNGKILAMSASADNVFISPAEIVMYDEDPTLIASGLSEILGVDYAEVLDKTKNTKSYYQTIAQRVEQEKADELRAFIAENKLNGIKLEPTSKRYYPYSSLAAHVIGFVGNENSGLGGLESYYEDELSGVNGRIVRAKNSYGTDMLYTKYEEYYDAQDGCDLTATIDSTIQFYMEKHLQQAVEDFDVQNGAAAIAMEVDTGEILGMVSLGNFDLNNYQILNDDYQALVEEAEDPAVKESLFSQLQQRQWRNKALSDTYEPGSTFKIITLAMALEEGVTNESDHFFCGGDILVTGDTDPRKCWKSGGHGDQTLAQSLQHSCNVTFISLGVRIGAETFYKYAESFGLLKIPQSENAYPTATTGIDLGGESGSLWWTPNVFYRKDNLSQLAAASFGQTFNVTPLQLITAVSACVNGGYLMQPHLVKSITDDEGVVTRIEPTVIRQVISEETSQKVCEMLETVVSDPKEGTGKNAYVAGYRIGGKTGTSEKVAQIAAGGPNEYIVSFVGVAPMDDPQIAILVLLDTPSEETGIYISGGRMGAPTVGKMMADILPYMGIEAQYTEEELRTLDRSVPDFVGMTIEEAEKAAEEAGFTFRTIGYGSVVTDQLPAKDAIVAAETQVVFYADWQASEELEEMPNLAGLSYSIARQRLGYYGLFINTDNMSRIDAENMLVSGQSIEEGTEVEHGTVVTVSLVDKDSSMDGRY